MTAIVSLVEARAHLRAEGQSDDAMLQIYISAAIDRVTQFIGQPIPQPAPPSIKAAVLLYVGDLYEHREAQVTGSPITANPTADALLWPYRTGLGI